MTNLRTRSSQNRQNLKAPKSCFKPIHNGLKQYKVVADGRKWYLEKFLGPQNKLPRFARPKNDYNDLKKNLDLNIIKMYNLGKFHSCSISLIVFTAI